MTKTIPFLFLSFGLLAACDTTVIEGDTTVVIILGDDGRPDSVVVDGEGFPIGLPPSDDSPAFNLGAIEGAWSLTEVEQATDGAGSVSVTASLDLEINILSPFPNGVAYLVRPIGSFALIECFSTFDAAATTTFSWVSRGCGWLEDRSIEMGIEIVADTLTLTSNDSPGLTGVAERLTDSSLGLDGGALRLKFARSARECFYCR